MENTVIKDNENKNEKKQMYFSYFCISNFIIINIGKCNFIYVVPFTHIGAYNF